VIRLFVIPLLLRNQNEYRATKMSVKSFIIGIFKGSLGIVGFLIFLLLPALFIVGALWLGERILPWLGLLSMIALGICIFVLLPLSIFRATRQVAGGLFLWISFIFGLTGWFFGLLLTYFLWGIIAVIIGLFILGIGVVPIGILAALLNGMWPELGILILAIVLTFGCRLFGAFLIANQERT